MAEKKEKIEQLIDLINNRLNSGKKEALLKELKADSELANTYSLLKKIMDARTGRETGAAIKLSRKLYRDFIKAKNNIRDKIGVIIYDSRLLTLPEGIRPAVVDSAVMRYKFDKFSLEISLYPLTTDSYEMIGQVSDFEPGHELSFTIAGQRHKQTITGDFYHLFRFPRLSVGPYRLSVADENGVIGTIELEI